MTAFIKSAIREGIAATLLILAVGAVGLMAALLNLNPIRAAVITCLGIMAFCAWGGARCTR